MYWSFDSTIRRLLLTIHYVYTDVSVNIYTYIHTKKIQFECGVYIHMFAFFFYWKTFINAVIAASERACGRRGGVRRQVRIFSATSKKYVAWLSLFNGQSKCWDVSMSLLQICQPLCVFNCFFYISNSILAYCDFKKWLVQSSLAKIDVRLTLEQTW